MKLRVRTVALAALAVALLAVAGAALQREASRRSELQAARTAASAATASLLAPGQRSALEPIEDSLRRVQAWRNAELAEATEHYLLGAREILRRRLEADRRAERAAAARAALEAHMRRAGGRDGRWIRTAAELKRTVEHEHFELRVQLEALATLLETLPEAQKRLVAHVDAAALLDEPARRAAAELQKARTLR